MDPRELLAQYADGQVSTHVSPHVRPNRIHMAPRAFSALERVLELHRPMHWYGECDHAHPNGAPDEFVVDDDYWTCEQGRVSPDRCSECTRHDADIPIDTGVVWPCATVISIVEALRETHDE